MTPVPRFFVEFSFFHELIGARNYWGVEVAAKTPGSAEERARKRARKAARFECGERTTREA